MNKPGDLRNACLILVALVFAAWCMWSWIEAGNAAAYRRDHCILVLGHWLSIENTTNPAYCQ